MYKEDLDQFPEIFYLNINRKGRYKDGSYCGVFLTFVMVLLILVYGLAKFATLLERPKSAMKV